MDKIIISGFSDEISPDFDEQLAAINEWGISHIELRSADGVNVSDFDTDKLREVKEKLDRAGVKVSSVGSPIGKINITDDFAPHFEKFKRTLEIQKELGAPYIRMFSFYIPKGEAPEKYKGEVFERIGALSDEAKRWESVLLHENEKGIYGDNAARCLELMEEFYSESFKAVFDFANFVEVGQPTMPAYKMLKPYIEYIHIKDVDASRGVVVPAGRGDGEVKAILSDLLSNGYEGFLSLEPHLVDFAGLAALEQDAKKRDSTMSGKEAWKLALDCLNEILAEI